MVEEIILCLYFTFFVDLDTLLVMVFGYIIISEIIFQHQKHHVKGQKRKRKNLKRKKKLYKRMNAL